MRKERSKLTEYLFGFKGIHAWRNLKDIPIVIKRLKFCCKYGYMPQGRWETFNYLTDIMTDIIKYYRYNRCGTPWMLENYSSTKEDVDKNSQLFDEKCDKLLEDLAIMADADNYDYGRTREEMQEKANKEQEAAKRFWSSIGEMYYSLWD